MSNYTTYKGFKIAYPSVTASVNRYGWNAVIFVKNENGQESRFSYSSGRPDDMLAWAKEWVDTRSNGWLPA